jgi:type IV pilus assembly protein PilE
MSALRPSVKGFTLIELVIVVGIVAILAAIAYPSYQQHVVKTRRAAAAGCLMEYAQFLERSFTTTMTYATAPPYTGQCITDTEEWYDIPPPAVAADGRSYTLIATPITTVQPDTLCGELGLTSTGQKSKSGTAATVQDCF